MSITAGGGSHSVEYQKSWQTSGSGEVQLHGPATEQDQAVREASGRLGTALADGFQDLRANPFSAGSYVLTSLLGGQTPNLSDFLAAARFEPAALAHDLQMIARGLSDRPVDTLQNMVLGAPSEAVDRALKGAEQGLQQIEEQTGLKREVQGAVSQRLGDYREFQLRQQLGDLGSFENRTQTRVGGEVDAAGQLKVGLAGAQGQGRVAGRVGADLQSDSRLDTVLGTATNRSRAWADSSVSGEGAFRAGLSGVQAQGSVGARAGVGASTQGRLENALAEVNYRAVASAEAYARAQGTGTLDARGLRADVQGEIGVAAAAEAQADFRTAGLTIGGERVDVNGQGKVRVEAAAKAEGRATVDATINPPRAVADIGGRAFAGVKAEAEGSIGIGQFATLSGKVGAWAGAGAEGGIKLGYNDGKLMFGFGGGAAVGYGFGGSWGVEIDVKRIANAAIGGAIEAAGKGLQYALNPTSAFRDAAKAVSDVQRGVATVAKTAEQVVSGAAKAIDGIVKKFKLWP